MLNEAILLLAGLTGLTVGAWMVVDSAKAIAHRMGISGLLIGLTIVSIGTSLPEIMVSVFSGIKGSSDVAIGAMVGSCLTQITLILGVSGVIHNITADRKAIRVDGTMLLISIALFWLVLFTGYELTRLEAIGLIAVYVCYLIYSAKHDHLSEQASEMGEHEKKGFPLGIRVLTFLIGIVFLVFSGDLVLNNALNIATTFGLSETFIGVMIIGVATCLPELSTAITSALKKAPGIGIGTLIGSNITDPLLSASSGALFHGFQVDPSVLFFDIPFWFVGSVLALLLLHRKHLTLNRHEATVLIIVYLGFVGMKIFGGF